MMNFELVSTPKTPYINLNSNTGVLTIAGRSIPQDSEEFWKPILNWLEDYSNAPNECTKVKFTLEYFNISSSKRILFFLYKLNEMYNSDHKVEVEWLFHENDEDMKEVGEDYALMVNVPFTFIPIHEMAMAM